MKHSTLERILVPSVLEVLYRYTEQGSYSHHLFQDNDNKIKNHVSYYLYKKQGRYLYYLAHDKIKDLDNLKKHAYIIVTITRANGNVKWKNKKAHDYYKAWRVAKTLESS